MLGNSLNQSYQVLALLSDHCFTIHLKEYGMFRILFHLCTFVVSLMILPSVHSFFVVRMTIPECLQLLFPRPSQMHCLSCWKFIRDVENFLHTRSHSIHSECQFNVWFTCACPVYLESFHIQLFYLSPSCLLSNVF